MMEMVSLPGQISVNPVSSTDKVKCRVTSRLLFVVVSASFGTVFGHGYASTQTNAVQNLILEWIRFVKCDHLRNRSFSNINQTNIWCTYYPTELQHEILGDNAPLSAIWSVCGCAVPLGAFCSLWFSNLAVGKIGIRNSLLAANVLGAIGSILTGICVYINSFEVLIIGRFIIGTMGGFALPLVPTYVTEISPRNLRGMMGVIPVSMMQIGVLFGVLVGSPSILGTSPLWPFIFWLRMVPVISLFVTLPFCPESPRHLLLVERREAEAQRGLVWLRRTEDVDEELEIIRTEQNNSANFKKLSIAELLKDSFTRKLLPTFIVLQLTQQFSGLSAIVTYSTSIFEAAGLATNLAVYGSIGLMIVFAVSVMSTIFFTERFGRRTLMLMGSSGAFVCLTGIVLFMGVTKPDLCVTCNMGTLVMMFLFMMSVSIGPGSIPFFIVSEMSDQTFRGSAMMFSSAICTAGGVVSNFVFPILQACGHQWSFIMFAVIMFGCTVHLYFFLVETKGKHITDIQIELRKIFI